VNDRRAGPAQCKVAAILKRPLTASWRGRRGVRGNPGVSGRAGGNRYLMLGLGTGPAADLALPPDRDELIAYGPLLSDNGATWLGTAVLVRARDPDTAQAVLTPDRYAGIEGG
jgi:hypothetical protein